jgi:ABC-type glycerol-3-phosphate transport system permease component
VERDEAVTDVTIVQPLEHPRRPLRFSQWVLNGTIIVILILSLIPVYLMIEMSFKNDIQYRWERWFFSLPLRLNNYPSAWEILGRYMLNTVFVAVVGLLGVLLLSLIGGHVFARMRFPFRELLFYAIIALLMVPGVLSLVPSYMLYNDFKLLNTFWVLIIPNIAGGPIFGIFLMRALISGIPEELYESARCDGAGVGTLIWKITLPLSLPGLATLTVLNFIGTWNSFLWPLLTITDTNKQMISVGLYKLSRAASGSAQSFGSFGPLYAGYVLASVPLVILFFLLGRFYVEGLVESGMKV